MPIGWRPLPLAGAAPPETITEDKWHQPLRDPVRRAGIAVALIAASGAVISPFALTQPETVTESRWHQSWSEPVRVKQGLPARQQQALAEPVFVPTTETITADKWLYQLSEPVRFRRLPVALQQSTAFVKSDPFPETVSIDRWLQPLSSPILRRKIPWHPSTAFIPEGSQAYSFAPLSEPVRVKVRQTAGGVFVAVVTTETITPDKWFSPLSEPARRKVSEAWQQALAFVKADPFPENVSVDRWLYRLSEPTRRKLNLPESVAAFIPAPSETVTLDKWYAQFATPTQRKSLHASRQQTIGLGPYPITASISGWETPFAEPIRRSLRPDTSQPAFVSVISTEVVTVDKWYRDFNTPTRPRSYTATLAPYAFQSNYLVPAPYVDPPMASWTYSWSAPVRLRLGLSAANQSGPVAPIIPQPNPPAPTGVYTVSGLYVIDQFTDNTVVYDYSGGVSHRTN